jgi:hypothetical protein
MKHKLTSIQKEMTTGLLLGDAWLERSSGSNTRLGLQVKRRDAVFFNHVRANLSGWLLNENANVLSRNPNNPDQMLPQLRLRTIYSPEFTPFYSNFYAPYKGNPNKRLIPSVSWLNQNFTGLSLAYLILCDGSRKSKQTCGYEIHLQDHGFESCVRLCLLLHEKFEIIAWPTYDYHADFDKGYWIVYIASQSYRTWEPLVADEIRACGLYDQKMPLPRVTSRPTAAQPRVFQELLRLFANNIELRDNLSYEAPENLIGEYREIQRLIFEKIICCR